MVKKQADEVPKGQCYYCSHTQEYQSKQAWYLHFKEKHRDDYQTKKEQNKMKRTGGTEFDKSLRERTKEMRRARGEEGDEGPLVDDNPIEVLKMASITNHEQEVKNRLIAAKFMEDVSLVWDIRIPLGIPEFKTIKFDANREFSEGDMEELQEFGVAGLKRRKIMSELASKNIPLTLLHSAYEFRDYNIGGGQTESKFIHNFAGELTKHLAVRQSAIVYCKLCLLIQSRNGNSPNKDYNFYEEGPNAMYSFLNGLIEEAYEKWRGNDFHQMNFAQ